VPNTVRGGPRAMIVLAGLLAFPLAASAGCPESCGEGQPCAADAAAPVAGCTQTASAVTTAAADPQAVLSSREAEGRRELALAEQQIKAAERATDDATRRESYRAAKEHAENAVERLPASADARFAHFAAAGRLAQLQGLASAAFQLMSLNAELDEVLRLDPNHANALAARGGMLVKLPRLLGGDTTEGIALLERAVSLDDTAVGKRLELAEAYHLVGRTDDAERTASSALAMAETIGDAPKVETCKRFINELRSTCSGCAMAAIGR
jgi:tetratricopeptide (TPR) repeat protein